MRPKLVFVGGLTKYQKVFSCQTCQILPRLPYMPLQKEKLPKKVNV